MRVQTTIEIFDYWNRIRGAADAPLKSQVEPSAVPHLLQSLFILETRDGGDIVFRLAGTRICDFFGRDLRGERFSSLWAHGQHADIERTAMGVMDHAMPALFNTTGYSTVGHQASFEIIMMPLRSSDGACDRLLGAIAPKAPASWLEIVPLEFLALDRSRLLPEKISNATPAELRSINEVVATKGIGFGQAMRRMVSQLLSAEAR
ncbi:PAS domain-containing protein [Rhizobium sp. N6212]|nr:PAS domain-containing protein [Rhizobium sp. N6212]ANK97797.1 PAS domain-containing protein [Rhizobium sp. N621]ANL03876.1 PAS domain-containing protein [Rhizobium esperanzae]ANL09922.1 PAS domain-containing protein [Rhizobium sp. N1341]ANM34725.1 PAS domain-containing protein [Rhizobium sp. N871]ANM40764.1 PAS domain-containing protein [Rhizobium sp. N741]